MCTLATPSNPSAGSACSTACPCGSRIPSLGRTSTRTRGTASGRPLEPAVEGLAGDAVVRLDVELARAGHDVVGELGRRRALVPAAAGGPVAHVLLVEARLRAA